MRFSFKKALATVLSVALVLSTFVGVLSVNATDATVAGTLTIDDASVTVDAENKFNVVANINLVEESELVEVMFKLGTLPEGITLTGATVDAGTGEYDGAFILDEKIHISVQDAVKDISVTMTFTALADALKPFTLKVVSFDYGDSTEVEKILDIEGASAEITFAHDCVGGEAVIENKVDADCVNTGSYDEVVYCTVCKAELSRTTTTVKATGHNYVDGKCDVCGEADPDAPQGVPVDPELVIYNNSASVAFGTSSLEMNFKVRKTVLELAKYDHVELVIVPQKYDLTTKNLVAEPEEIVVPASEFTGSSIRSYKYTEMMLYELALDINYKLRGYDAEGNLIGESIPYTTSPVSYLKNTLLANESTAANLKKVAVDILVVCEEARIAMAKTGTDLEADSKVSVLEGVDLTLGSEQTLTGECAYTNNFEPLAEGWGTTITSNPGVSIDKVPVLNARIKDSKALDLSKLELRVTYDSVGAAGHVEETLAGEDLARASNYVNAKFYNVGLHDSNAAITVEYYYEGEHTATLTYYIETYLYSQKDNATIGKLVIALVKLGESFRALKYSN